MNEYVKSKQLKYNGAIYCSATNTATQSFHLNHLPYPRSACSVHIQGEFQQFVYTKVMCGNVRRHPNNCNNNNVITANNLSCSQKRIKSLNFVVICIISVIKIVFVLLIHQGEIINHTLKDWVTALNFSSLLEMRAAAAAWRQWAK